MQKDRESGKTGGRTVVRIRGVTDDAAAAFVRLLYAGSRYPVRLLFLEWNLLLLVLFSQNVRCLRAGQQVSAVAKSN